jgi:phospholipase C
MPTNPRRRFLQMAGGVAGAMVAGQVLPESVRRALEIPANRRTGTIRDVEHVVVLMQENRSFDHYFGSLRGVRGFDDPRPLRFSNGTPVWHQPNAMVHTSLFKSRGMPDESSHVPPFHIDTGKSGFHWKGTDHGWSSGHLAWNEGRYDQWVTQKQDVLTMGYLRREDIAFHYALADAFTVCDSYFCSAHADTAINRIFLWSGTADPRNIMGSRPNGPGLAERRLVNGYTWTTYPERLEAKGVSWKLYQGGTGEPGSPTDNYTDNSLEFFARYQIGEGANPQGPLVRKGASQHTLADLRDDVLFDRLPQVSWIVAPFKYCEHPDGSPEDGAVYINKVLEALTANPESWSKTVLFLNYDENDGFFDHVVPPMPPIESGRNRQGMVSAALVDSLRDEILDLDLHPSMNHPLIPGADPGGLQPIGLGARVPMIVVSPWTTGGWVCSQTFDHTSVLQFLEARFGVAEPNISAWRRAVCGDLTSAFDFAGTPDTAVRHFQPAIPQAPSTVPINAPDDASIPMQEPGLRPARALPYQWTVEHRLDSAAGLSWLDLVNTGAAGAAFYIYDHTMPGGAPRRYTAAANDTLADCWPLRETSTAYDATVHGPNGYVCQVRGETGEGTGSRPAVEVRIRYDIANQRVIANLKNTGATGCHVEVHDAYAQGMPLRYALAVGASSASVWSVAASHGWYDIAVTLDGSKLYLRRFAGRLETGLPGTSDPGPLSDNRDASPLDDSHLRRSPFGPASLFLVASLPASGLRRNDDAFHALRPGRSRDPVAKHRDYRAD